MAQTPAPRLHALPFTYPDSPVPSTAAIMAAFATLRARMAQWRTAIGPQPLGHQQRMAPYVGDLLVRRGFGSEQIVSLRAKRPYTATAHAALAIARAEQHVLRAFLVFEQTLLAVPALRSPALCLGLTHRSPDSGTDMLTISRITLGMGGLVDHHLERSLERIAPLATDPGDPIWMVEHARIGAPSAAHALALYHALAYPAVEMGPKKPLPVVRHDCAKATHQAAMALLGEDPPTRA